MWSAHLLLQSGRSPSHSARYSPRPGAASDSQSKPNSPVGIRPCQALNKHREPCCVFRHRFQRTRGLQQGAARDRMFRGYHPLGQAMKRLISKMLTALISTACAAPQPRGPSGGTNHLFPVSFPISGEIHVHKCCS